MLMESVFIRLLTCTLAFVSALSVSVTRREPGWNDPDIIAEPGHWVQLPSSIFQEKAPRPFPPQKAYNSEEVQNVSSIVVLIAAFRESRAVDTLQSMFSRAWNSSRVFVGVVQQNTPGDEDALEELCRRLDNPLELKKKFRGREDLHKRQHDEDIWGHSRYTQESLEACEPARRVRMFRMASEEAKGPAYARARQPLLLENGDGIEDFCMQIDAHTIFVQGWDDEVVRQWAATDNEYAVLTTYPTNANDLTEDGYATNTNNHWEMPHLCTADIVGPGMIRNGQAGAAAMLTKPPLSKFWAAGLSFSRCHAERDVPADPEMRHIFNGEEFGRGARLWTNGYDFYSMARPVIGTYYGNEKGGKGSWRGNSAELRAAEARLAQLFECEGGDLSSLKGFGLGKRRELDAYLKLTGIDFHSSHVTNTPCAVDHWVPWSAGGPPAYEMLPESPVALGVDIASRQSAHRDEGFLRPRAL